MKIRSTDLSAKWCYGENGWDMGEGIISNKKKLLSV